MKFEHIGLLCIDVELGIDFVAKHMNGSIISDIIVDPVIDVKVCFIEDKSGLKYELISPNSSQSPVALSLLKRQNILHHLAYTVEALDKQLALLRNSGCVPIMQPTPAVAFSGRRVAFMLTQMDFIIEVIEEKR